MGHATASRSRAGRSTARSFYLQGVQTITPRLFAAARVAHVLTPPIIFGTERPTTISRRRS